MRFTLLLFLLFFCDIECRINGSCSGKPCIQKCCPEDQIVYVHQQGKYKIKQCETVTYSLNVTDLYLIENENENDAATNDSLDKYLGTISGVFNRNKTLRKLSMDVKKSHPSVKFYLTKDAVLIKEMPNIYERYTYIENDMFCIDYTNYSGSNDSVKVTVWVVIGRLPKNALQSGNDTFYTLAMMVSSAFLLLVLIVYGVLPELRNLGGMILMAYVVSLLCAFVLLATMRIKKSLPSPVCVNFTCAIYFFLISTFCWMNVMSYDIWLTFRGYAQSLLINRKGERFKFCMYLIYAFGVPLALTIFLRVVNDLDLTHIPWFIKPNVPRSGCFISGGQKLVYLYIPMLILIICNWLLYLMTAYNLWRLSRGTAVLDSEAESTNHAHRSLKRRFFLYLKLSIVMGLNWVLEVGSFLVPSWSNLWWVSDSYNLFIGVAIFFIFVCKPSILRKLKKLAKKNNMMRWIPDTSSRSNTSSFEGSSQETQMVNVCSNPKGSTALKNINNF